MQGLTRIVYVQLSRALLVSSKAEFGPYEAEIAQLSQAVRDEASLASWQAQKLENELQDKERSKNSKSQDILVKLRDSFYHTNEENKTWRLEINRRRLERKKMEALDSLSTYDYHRTYRQIRKECIPGTSMWICEDPEFQAWLIGSLKTLRFTGRFIGSTVRQLVGNLPADAFLELNHKRIDGDAIINFLESALSCTHQHLIVLDGLDECEEVQIREIADFLYRLLVSPVLRIKLFWSSRPNVPSWLPEKFVAQRHIDSESAENQRKVIYDIHKFIRVTLEELLEGETPELQINDPALVITILDHLEKKAQGIFLWVKLQFRTLREQNSDNQILTALNHLPRDLPETFERILSQNTETGDKDIGSRIFRWIAVAKRPLTLEELREAISITPLQETWDAQSLINNMNKAVAYCKNLIFVDEEHHTVHFTHSSVKQYLLSRAVEESLGHYFVNLERADADAGAVCVTYLNFPVFNKQVAETTRKNIHLTDVESTVIKNSLPSGKFASKIALRLLRQGDKSGKSVDCFLEEAKGETEAYRKQNVLMQFSFLPYAERFWLDHTKHGMNPDSKELRRLLQNLIEEAGWRNTLSGISWTVEDWEKRSHNIIPWIVEQNHRSLAQLLLTSNPKLTQQNLEVLVKGAASKGHEQLLEICLESADITQFMLDSSLKLAAARGYLAAVERLLQEKANVDAAAGYYGRTALQAAAEGGHLVVVEKLLQKKADVNAAASKYNGRTTL
ncbi:MAG: hypothetical protein Q9164_006976 [Protoblastenia rupestris]